MVVFLTPEMRKIIRGSIPLDATRKSLAGHPTGVLLSLLISTHNLLTKICTDEIFLFRIDHMIHINLDIYSFAAWQRHHYKTRYVIKTHDINILFFNYNGS